MLQYLFVKYPARVKVPQRAKGTAAAVFYVCVPYCKRCNSAPLPPHVKGIVLRLFSFQVAKGASPFLGNLALMWK